MSSYQRRAGLTIDEAEERANAGDFKGAEIYLMVAQAHATLAVAEELRALREAMK